ncbi:MAG: M48 family metalloprotease, partial [Gammaproteobacteria bacterium]|nr:M48 family metalloprotease [Gammaproteobacteria bacterium]
MNPSYDLKQTRSADWRAQLVTNQRRTFFVIASFVLIYLAIGFLVDLIIHGGFDGGMDPQHQLGFVFQQLITFQTIPYATITMAVVAVVSLFVTYSLYDRLMLLGTQHREITPQTAQSTAEQQLYNVVEEMRIAAGLSYLPKIFVIEADYMNAFASGYSEKSAMIAITSGLLEKLDRDELQAVIAHELSHIRHGDIKLTLTAA